LGFWIDADRTRSGLCESTRDGRALVTQELREREHFIEGGNLEMSVEECVAGPQLGKTLARAQRLQLGQREVLREPSFDGDAVGQLRGLAPGELRPGRHVRRIANLVLVARDQHAVSRHDEIGLDVIRTLLSGNEVGSKSMLWHVTAGAAV